MSSRLAPLVGHIVLAWFPESESVSEPGPKARPVLVLEADDQHLLCAYGTSNTHCCYRGEFRVSSDDYKLTRETKFSLKKVMRLPFQPNFFQVDGRLVSLGQLTPSDGEQLYLAMQETGMV